jgi:hypothetical protein
MDDPGSAHAIVPDGNVGVAIRLALPCFKVGSTRLLRLSAIEEAFHRGDASLCRTSPQRHKRYWQITWFRIAILVSLWSGSISPNISCSLGGKLNSIRVNRLTPRYDGYVYDKTTLTDAGVRELL